MVALVAGLVAPPESRVGAGVSAAGVVGGRGVAPRAVPTGFVDEPVATVAAPTAVEVLPDGRIVVADQGGRLLAGAPGGPLVEVARFTDTCVGSERGLLGFTHDPGYLTNRRVFVYRTRVAPDAPGGCVNRVSSFAMPGSLDVASETVLLDDISSLNGNHNGGDLDVGADGHLYVSVGDAGRDPRGDSGPASANDAARDLSILNGKILRVTLDGAPAPGNPLTGPGTDTCAFRGATPTTPSSSCREIHSWGWRNPYRMAFDPDRDRFYANDVGQVSVEEVNEAEIGGDFGWNRCEGPCPPGVAPDTIDPVTSYPRSVGTFITAGAFVPAGFWPEALDGAYLFADGGTGDVFVLPAGGTVEYDAPWAEVGPGLADMTFAFDEHGRLALYYVLNATGEIRRIVWTGAPSPPTPTGLAFEAVSPVRADDTRTAGPGGPGRLRAGTTRMIDLAPPSDDVRSALVNVTVTDNAGWGFVQAWTPRTRRPGTSVVNVVQPGEDVANAAVVALDDEGRFVVHTSVATHVVVDVLGWFVDTGDAPVAAGRFEPVAPGRLVDTRRPPGDVLASGAPNPYTETAAGPDTVGVGVDVAGRLAVPDDGTATALVAIVTAIGEAGPRPGFATVHPGGVAPPDASNVNTGGSGDVRANLAIVPIGADGSVGVELVRVDDVLVDVVGYVTSPSAPSSRRGLFDAVAPVRVFDERAPDAADVPPGGTVTIDHGAVVPGAGDALAVVQNLTITDTTGFGFVGSSPAPAPGDSVAPPEVSNVNATAAGQTRAALAVTPYGPGGRITHTVEGDSALIADVVGLFRD